MLPPPLLCSILVLHPYLSPGSESQFSRRQEVPGSKEMHPGTPATSGLPEPAPQELCAFMSGVAARILRTLQRRKARVTRRKPNHRRFLYKQLCRSFVDIQDATQHLALTVLSQQGPGPQPQPRLQRPPSPFLGVAQALAAPESPGPGLALSPSALQSPAHELLEIIPLSPRLHTPGPSLLPPASQDPSMLALGPPASSLFVQAPHLSPMACEPADLPDNPAGIQYQVPGQSLPYGAPARALGASEGTLPSGTCWVAGTEPGQPRRGPEPETLCPLDGPPSPLGL